MTNVPGAAGLTVDFAVNPLGVEGDKPRLGWRLTGCALQNAYRVEVSSSCAGRTGDLWDSGRVTGQQPWTLYAGQPLTSNVRCIWRVKVWDDAGRESDWSEKAWFQTGIRASGWHGQWVGFDEGRDQYDASAPYYCADDFELGENNPFLPPPVMVRKAFDLPEGRIRAATLYVSAMGLTEVYLNGARATAGHMIPGICDWRKRCYYRAYDATFLIREGENALGAVLADGWYAGYIGLNPRAWWGQSPRINLMLAVEYEGGRTREICTDGSWRAAFGPYLYADILHGSGYDATREIPGWAEAGFVEDGWRGVDAFAVNGHIPCAHPGPPIIEHARFPASVLSSDEDSCLLDFGRCFSGVARLTLEGRRGAQVDVYHAEELKDGRLYLRGNRSAQAHDRYILSGSGREVFQPEFTYHGFRYARVVGLGSARLISAEGIAISSALPSPTRFESGNDTVNRVHRMILNTLQSNLFDMPTDVCARDERLGWGAEGHFFLHTAALLNDNARFMRKWMRDIADGQLENGSFWAIAPAVMMKDIVPFAGDLQSDMGIHVCWLLYTVYADTESIKAYFPALERHFAFLEDNSDRLIRFAIARDWLDLGPDGRSDMDHGYGHSPAGLLGTAYFACSARMMADMAGGLGLEARKAYYAEKYASIRTAFRTFFLKRDGLLRDATQGSMLLAIAFDLLEADEVALAREVIKKDILSRGVTWGTATAPVALWGMEKAGLAREAAAFLARDEFPSLGYMARSGATAVWERWDALLDGQFHPHPMNAFDHIGLATVGQWMIAGLAGIRALKPGFEMVLLKPAISGVVGSVDCTYQSLYGPIRSAWAVEGARVTYRCAIAPGIRARVELPGMAAFEIGPGEYEYQVSLEEAK